MLGAAIYLFWGEPWWVLLLREPGSSSSLLSTTNTGNRRQCSLRVVAAAGSAAQATEAPAGGKGAERQAQASRGAGRLETVKTLEQGGCGGRLEYLTGTAGCYTYARHCGRALQQFSAPRQGCSRDDDKGIAAAVMCCAVI
ncbi:hypothetical protein SVAN01_02402 [Stagonosporopsis vannaccii]|nr:hypothetical protein SVAN01_02402 [Stagonosporopsis vannaccii]